jgi:NitT/TauT family transport system substrate-binding protein
MALVLLLAGCGAAKKSSHVVIGLAVPGATYLPIYLASDAGLYAKEGLETELIEFRGGADLIKALASGSVDVGVVSLAEVTMGIDAGQPLKAFYAGFNVPDFAWYAVPPIQSLAQAKQKRFGVTQYGASSDYITRYVLAVNGIDPAKDAQILQSGQPATRLAAMEAGQLDVSIFSGPEKLMAAERGYKQIYSQKNLSDDYPYHVIFAMEPYISAHADTLKSLLRAHVAAVRLAKQDKQRSMESLAKHLQMDSKYAGPTYDDFIGYIYEDGRLPSSKALDLFFDMGIRVGRYKERWPLSKYWTPAFVDTFGEWSKSS